MAKFNPKEVEEINSVIKSIQTEVKPGMEIGAKDRAVLAGLLSTNDIKKTPKHFKCKREHSDAIVSFFVKEKGLTKNKFSSNLQTSVYLIEKNI